MAEIILETKNEDGDPVTHNLHLEDEHATDETDVVRSLAERAEKAAGLSAENETLREALVSETIRRKKLAGKLGGEDEIQDEREFLQGLPAPRLKKHYERALDLDIDTGGNLDAGKQPAGASGGSTYEDLGL